MNIKKLCIAERELGMTKAKIRKVMERNGCGSMTVGKNLMVDIDEITAAIEKERAYAYTLDVSCATGLSSRDIDECIREGWLKAERVHGTWRFESLEYAVETIQGRMREKYGAAGTAGQAELGRDETR